MMSFSNFGWKPSQSTEIVLFFIMSSEKKVGEGHELIFGEFKDDIILDDPLP